VHDHVVAVLFQGVFGCCIGVDYDASEAGMVSGSNGGFGGGWRCSTGWRCASP
jgi:hypothetical protein